MDKVQNYVELVKEPWGKMFYDLLFIQLALPMSPRLRILDFGSGLGVTASHYAAWHEVTAIEPNNEMTENRRTENPYTQISGGVESLAAFGDGFFDVVFCHNVLEYIEDKEPVIAEIMRVLKPGGCLSLVKHNRVGRVFHRAVFWNDPKKALLQTDHSATDKNDYLGTQYIYSNEDAKKWLAKHKGSVSRILGMRTFYALGQDNSIKYDKEWYNNMLALEAHAADIAEFKNAAFLNHLLVEKMNVSMI
jgi:SAM-dependent methyltransferase